MLSDNELLRYSLHLLLEEVSEAGQHKLKQAKVLIIGMGGLGSHAPL
ncbi:ThiF family adenylyltransferase [Psychromonas aquatilis]|uniref:ThiF family adenylyltransferase n=1 Tax=Psychromonas aquatilis TaxID=2005072 RepID=A0ABU9GUF4_9GAMM